MCITITERQNRILELFEPYCDYSSTELYYKTDSSFENTDQVRSCLNALQSKGLVAKDWRYNTWYRTSWCMHYEVSCGAYGNHKAHWGASNNVVVVPILVPVVAVQIPKLVPIHVKKDYFEYLLDCNRSHVIANTREEYMA